MIFERTSVGISYDGLTEESQCDITSPTTRSLSHICAASYMDHGDAYIFRAVAFALLSVRYPEPNTRLIEIGFGVDLRVPGP